MQNGTCMTELETLMAQLTPEEQSGAMLAVKVPKGTLKKLKTCAPKEILAEVQNAIVTQAIHEALTEARRQAGLKAKDIAKTMEISAARVAQIESKASNLTLETLIQYANAADYGVEIVLHSKKQGRENVHTILS
jgi:ribosome-binding protein aMBF1 (putative translation factor)